MTNFREKALLSPLSVYIAIVQKGRIKSIMSQRQQVRSNQTGSPNEAARGNIHRSQGPSPYEANSPPPRHQATYLPPGPHPMKMTCPSCNLSVITITECKHKRKASLGCLLCCCIPICIPFCRCRRPEDLKMSVEHYCPNCRVLMRTYITES